MGKLPLATDKIIFLLSPLVSFPLIIRGIFYKNRISLILFFLLIGFISYGFIPVDGNDKAYYIYLFNMFGTTSIEDFYSFFLRENTDFVFYTLLYFVNWIGLSFEFFSLIVTFTTCYYIFIPFYELSIESNNRNKQALMFFFMVIMTLSIPDLLSGMRNYLSIAFVFYSIHLLVSSQKLRKAIIFLILGIITHYSSFIYIIVFLLYSLCNKKIIKALFLISLGFIFLPKSYLLDIFSSIGLPEVYSAKSVAYLSEDSYIDNSLAVGNTNNLIRYILNSLWFYVALIFSIINIKNTGNKFIFFISLMTIINIISPSADLLVRYGLLASIALLLTIFYEKNLQYRYLFIYLMLGINFSTFIIDIIVMYDSLYISLYKSEYLTLATMFFIDATTNAGVK